MAVVEVGELFREVAFDGLGESVGEGQQQCQPLRAGHAQQVQRCGDFGSAPCESGNDGACSRQFAGSKPDAARHTGECTRQGSDTFRGAIGHGQAEQEAACSLHHGNYTAQSVIGYGGKFSRTREECSRCGQQGVAVGGFVYCGIIGGDAEAVRTVVHQCTVCTGQEQRQGAGCSGVDFNRNVFRSTQID